MDLNQAGPSGNRSNMKNLETAIPVQLRDKIIGQAVGQAVAQVKNFFDQSGLMETANKLQKQLEKTSAGNDVTLRVENSDRSHNNVPEVIDRQKGKTAREQVASVVIGKDKQIQPSPKSKFKSRIPVQTPVEKRNSSSVVTIYENAVKDGTKRQSSSSEEGIFDADTSDENVDLIDNFITDQRREFDHRRR